MNQRDKNRILENYTALRDAIMHGVEDVCIRLLQKKLITASMKDSIIEINVSPGRKTTKLLDLIMTRGPDAYEALYSAVLEEEFYKAADILKPGKAPHEPQPDWSMSGPTPPRQATAATARTATASTPTTSPPVATNYDSPDESLPHVWPDETVIRSLGTVVYVKTEQMQMLFRDSLKPGQDSIYQMKQQTRGDCLVFNIENFTNWPDNRREGSDKDCAVVEKLFGHLGFNVIVYKDTTSKEMWKVMEEEAKKDHTQADCFVMFIFSHGKNGVVFGTDGRVSSSEQAINFLKIQDIRNRFCDVRSLSGKPKLFFIQACQGAKKDEGFDSHDGGATNTWVSGVPTNLLTSQQQRDRCVQDVRQTLENMSVDQADEVKEKVPTHADVFIAMATTADYIAWRHRVLGSWFVQALVYVLGRYAHKHELKKLMTMVNNLVSKAEAKEDRSKQIGDSTSTMRKDFYFFPGLPTEKEHKDSTPK